MSGKKIFINLITVALLLTASSSSVLASDDEITGGLPDGLETGFYVIVTVNLEQVMSMRRPKLFWRFSVLRTTWTPHEIRSCWAVGIDNCIRDRTEDYVEEFFDFYRTMNVDKAGKRTFKSYKKKNRLTH
jgi:hypothetical protein